MKTIFPKTKFQAVIFTLLMSFFMASIMYLYNQAIHMGGLSYNTFLTYDYRFLITWAIAFLVVFFIVHPLAERLTFKIVNPQKDSGLVINVTMSTLTVVMMVTIMSCVGVLMNAIVTNSFSAELFLTYLTSIVTGFVFALPLQILVVGPLVRALFTLMFSKAQKRARAKIIFSHSSQPAMMPVASEEKHSVKNQKNDDNIL